MMINDYIKNCIKKSSHNKEKCNIFLDLDNTLISSIPYNYMNDKYRNIKCKSHVFESEYIIYERPHLQKFLDFLFKHFNVNIWTAASKDYALFIIDKIIIGNHRGRKINFILYNDHCKLSSNIYKNTTPKDLRLTWEKIDPYMFNRQNTFIIDDLRAVFEAQPNNCINVRAFDLEKYPSHENDVILENLLGELRKGLLQ